MVKKFIEFINESFKGKIYYHGTDKEHNLHKDIFLSDNIDFSKDYGDYIYKVKVLTDNIFDPSFNDKHLDQLFDYFKELEDPYDDSIITKEDFKGHSDTWSIIEQDYVLHWIKGSGYDGVQILEGGSNVNLLIFDPKNIKKI
jgi:hypothetical protein